MPIQAIPPEQLRRTCRVNHFAFESTAELETISSIIGQPRGTQAIEFGIGIQSHGYNMYVLGDMGTGRTTAIKRFLEEKTRTRPVPPDWVYVNNFGVPTNREPLACPRVRAQPSRVPSPPCWPAWKKTCPRRLTPTPIARRGTR